MTPENLVEELEEVLGASLESVILYGSAASGDHKGRQSDYNIMAITSQLGVEQLNAIAPVAKEWDKSGNPPPLLFTMNRLMKSTDVFPLEMHDIKDSRKILFGSDPIKDMVISKANLRLELEHELKGKLIQLRENYLLAAGNPKAVLELMVKSLSTFLVLFRGALRLVDTEVPACKMEALKLLAEKLNFDIKVFTALDEVKSGKVKPKEVQPFTLFSEYLRTIETVVDLVDDLEKQNE